jgi:hypothetical protein
VPNVLTTVPAVLTALVQLGQTTLAGQTGPKGGLVTVFDGPPNTDSPPDEFLSIGFSRDEDDGAVDGDTTDEGNHTSSETYSVHCILSCATGDTHTGAVAERRARCNTLWALFAAGLRADPTLGGVLVGGAQATLSSWSWIYGPTTGGVVSEVEFDVAVTAAWLGMT